MFSKAVFLIENVTKAVVAAFDRLIWRYEKSRPSIYPNDLIYLMHPS
ncbi:hypothetical protein Nizo2776_1312 [Lactiplantibacillus plantarum]|nr:hypothetical protein Nizo2776_1312 [Lactiplantibacillus plantarum]